jgi:hypothetical protein
MFASMFLKSSGDSGPGPLFTPVVMSLAMIYLSRIVCGLQSIVVDQRRQAELGDQLLDNVSDELLCKLLAAVLFE